MSDMDLIIYIDDFFNILKHVALIAILFILKHIAPIAILVALFQYLREIPQRKRQAELNAWQTINSAMNQKAASGRVEALEYLNNAGVDLSFLSVPDAYLVGTTKKGDSKGTRGINLLNAQLTEANFKGSTLTEANFRNANLTEANLKGASLAEANLFYASLEGANLWDADLWGANLAGADIWGANLAGANLFNARLEGANLVNAHLREAKLEGADLSKADLRGAYNITWKQLCKAKTLYEAKLDLELLVKVKKECPLLLEEPKRVE